MLTRAQWADQALRRSLHLKDRPRCLVNRIHFHSAGICWIEHFTQKIPYEEWGLNDLWHVGGLDETSVTLLRFSNEMGAMSTGARGAAGS